MKFYLYTPNNFDNYLPLLLYKKSIENIIKNNILGDIILINENDQINYVAYDAVKKEHSYIENEKKN